MSNMTMMDAFVDCHKMLLYSELDGCNNAELFSISIYQLLANRYNENNFCPLSFAMHHVDSAFKKSFFVIT